MEYGLNQHQRLWKPYNDIDTDSSSLLERRGLRKNYKYKTKSNARYISLCHVSKQLCRSVNACPLRF